MFALSSPGAPCWGATAADVAAVLLTALITLDSRHTHHTALLLLCCCQRDGCVQCACSFGAGALSYCFRRATATGSPAVVAVSSATDAASTATVFFCDEP